MLTKFVDEIVQQKKKIQVPLSSLVVTHSPKNKKI